MQFELLGVIFNIYDEEPFVRDDFDKAALEFFDKANNDISLHDSFFSKIAEFANQFIQVELWHKSETIWERVLQPALVWEKLHQHRFINKGTPFYFWGMAAICRGELDVGYPLMHQALQEDVRNLGVQNPNTPAYSFATFDYINPNQAFKLWLDHLAAFLDDHLKNYRLSYNRSLHLADLRQKFLLNPPNLETVFLFSYSVGRLSLFRIPEFALCNVFAAQLEVNLLFDLLLVIDNSIKAHNPNQRQFSLHLAFLAKQASLNLDQNKLQNQFSPTFDNNPDGTLLDVLAGRFHFQDGSIPLGMEKDLLITYGMRNYGAHEVSSLQTVWQRYGEIRQALFNVLFLCIEVLY